MMADSFHSPEGGLSSIIRYDVAGGTPADRHNGGANILWVDGHVSWASPEMLPKFADAYYWLPVK